MKRDALLIIDVQNDFCPGGALAVPGGDEVVPVLNEYAARFARAGAPVYASRDWHPPETRHFRAGGGPWPPHCVRDTFGAAFHPDLALPEGTGIVSAGTGPDDDGYSAFEGQTGEGTSLGDALRRDGVRRVFVGGLATDYCVRATVLDAAREGFDTVLLLDAVRGLDLNEGDVARSIREMEAAGARTATLDSVEELLHGEE